MNTSTKAMMAAIQAAFLAIVPLALADGSYAADTGEETEYDTDLGEFWSMTIGFSYSGEGARSVTWDFGDGSEPVTAFSEIHTFENKGVYYVTQTAHNTNGDSVAVYKVTIMGYPYVEFDTQGGSDIARIDMTSGGINATAATEPEEVPTKTGFTFTGWYTTPECEELYDWTSIVSEPVKVYAGWSENAKANIVFDVDEGYPPVETVQWTIGTEYTVPGYDGTKDGYTFDGWSYDGQTYLEGQKIVITGDMTLTAVWNELNRYTVSFDLAGGTGTFPAQTVYVNETATEPEPEPTKTGHTFAGWYLGDEPYVFTTPVTGNITLTAHWTPVEYTVIFDSAGGSDVPEQKVQYGSKATEPADPTKSSYRFEGWLLNGAPYDFDTPVTGNITLVADWSYVQPPVTRYTVTFDPDNGEGTFTSTVVAGNAVSKPADPVREGYTFAGWFVGDEVYTFGTPVKSDLTITAHWTPIATFTVTFDSMGGTKVSEQTVAQGDSVQLPEIARVGYVLKGWQVGDDVMDAGEEFTPTSDVTVKAVWEARSYTVSYHDDGAATLRDITVKHGAKAVNWTPAERDGYTFGGWLLDGEPYDFGTPVTSDIVLVADYEPLPPTVPVDKVIPDDAVMTEPIPDDIVDGEEIRLPDASRPGHSFQGWDTDGDGEVDAEANETVEYIDGQTELVPIFEELTDEEKDKQHQITIEDAPEIPYDQWYVEEDAPIILPDIPREDETLVGYGDGDGNLYAPGEEFAPTEDVTLRPVFEPKEPVAAEIVLGAEDAALIGGFPDRLYVGSFLTLPDATRPGFELSGWDVVFGEVSAMALYRPGDVVEITGPVTITAVWSELAEDAVQYKVVVVFGDDDSQTYYVTDDRPFTVPAPAATDGFEGFADQDGFGYQPGDSFYVAEDMILTTQYAESPSDDDGSGTDWWIYAVVVIVILALIALVLILHFRVGVI